MHQMFNGVLVYFVLIFNLYILQHMQSVICWHAHRFTNVCLLYIKEVSNI